MREIAKFKHVLLQKNPHNIRDKQTEEKKKCIHSIFGNAFNRRF